MAGCPAAEDIPCLSVVPLGLLHVRILIKILILLTFLQRLRKVNPPVSFETSGKHRASLAVREEIGQELVRLRRINEALLGELERRRLEAEKPKRRPWWKWWDG